MMHAEFPRQFTRVREGGGGRRPHIARSRILLHVLPYLITKEEFRREEYFEDARVLIRFFVRLIYGIPHYRQTLIDVIGRILQSQITLQSILPLRLAERVHCISSCACACERGGGGRDGRYVTIGHFSGKQRHRTIHPSEKARTTPRAKKEEKKSKQKLTSRALVVVFVGIFVRQFVRDECRRPTRVYAEGQCLDHDVSRTLLPTGFRSDIVTAIAIASIRFHPANVDVAPICVSIRCEEEIRRREYRGFSIGFD